MSVSRGSLVLARAQLRLHQLPISIGLGSCGIELDGLREVSQCPLVVVLSNERLAAVDVHDILAGIYFQRCAEVGNGRIPLGSAQMRRSPIRVHLRQYPVRIAGTEPDRLVGIPDGILEVTQGL